MKKTIRTAQNLSALLVEQNAYLRNNMVYWLEWVGHIGVLRLLLLYLPACFLRLFTLLSVSMEKKPQKTQLIFKKKK